MYLQIAFSVLFLSLSVSGEDVVVKVHISNFTNPITGLNPFIDIEEGYFDERREWKERRPFQLPEDRVMSPNVGESEIPKLPFEDRSEDIVDSNAITNTEKSFVIGADKTEAGERAPVFRALESPKIGHFRRRGTRKCGFKKTSRISNESGITSGATSIHGLNKEIGEIVDWLNNLQTRIEIFYRAYVYIIHYFLISSLVLIYIFCLNKPAEVDLNPNANNRIN